MYLFSACLLFSGYYVDIAFGQNLFTTVTVIDGNSTRVETPYDYLNELMSEHQVREEPSLELLFGDFIAAGKVIFGIITGQPIAAAFGALPNVDEVWMLLIQLIFTFSTLALWAFVIAGRSI